MKGRFKIYLSDGILHLRCFDEFLFLRFAWHQRTRFLHLNGHILDWFLEFLKFFIELFFVKIVLLGWSFLWSIHFLLDSVLTAGVWISFIILVGQVSNAVDHWVVDGIRIFCIGFRGWFFSLQERLSFLCNFFCWRKIVNVFSFIVRLLTLTAFNLLLRTYLNNFGRSWFWSIFW